MEGADGSSLRLLGTVGEPINPEAWHWYYETVGRSRCPIVDTGGRPRPAASSSARYPVPRRSSPARRRGRCSA